MSETRLHLEEDMANSDADVPFSGWLSYVLLGPDMASLKDIRHVRATLTRLGVRVSEIDDDVLWAAWDIGLGVPADDIHRGRLAWWLTALWQAMAGCRTLGLLVTSRSEIALHAVRDEALEVGERLLARVRPGEMLLTGELAERLEGRTLQAESLPESDLWRIRPAVHWETTRGRDDQRIAVLSTSPGEPLDELEVDVAPSRVERYAGVQPGPAPGGAPLLKGDQLSIRFRVPEQAWVYLLLQRDLELTLPFGARPARRPGQPAEQVKELLLDDRPGKERPLLVVAGQALTGLNEAVREVNRLREQKAERRLEALFERLRERHGALTLLEAGDFAHERAAEWDRYPVLQPAREAIERGDNVGAERLLRSLLEAGDLAGHAEPLVLLGTALRRQGRFGDAFAVLEPARAAAEASGDVGGAADLALELGWVEIGRGRAEEAQRWLDHAVEGHRQANDRIGEARDHVAIGCLLTRQDRFEPALRVYHRAYRLCQLGDDPRVTGNILTGIGQAMQDLSMLRRARHVHSEALECFTRGGDRRGQMVAHGDLGILAMNLGDTEKAIAHFRAQLELVRTMGAPALLAISRLNLGHALLAAGQGREARDMLTRAAEALSSESPGPRFAASLFLSELALREGRLEEAGDRLDTAAPWLDSVALDGQWRYALLRARWRVAMGDPEAVAEYRRGIDALESHRGALPLELRTEFLELSTPLFEGWIQSLATPETSGEVLLDAIERARARAFLDALSATAPEGGMVPDTTGTDDGARPLPLPELRRLLPEEVMFIATYSLPEQLELFRVTRTGVQRRTLPVTRAQLEQLTGTLLARCRTRPGETEPGTAEALQAFVDTVVEPIRDWLEEAAPEVPIGIVPHGPLHEVPFHALPWHDGHDRQPLVMNRKLFYAPSLQAVARWLTRGEAGGAEPLVLADVEGDLPFARVEARQVAELLGGAQVAVGREATAEKLERLGPGARLIHLALHAQRGAPGTRAALLLAPSGHTGHLDEEPAPWDLDPDLRSLPPGAVDASWVARLKLRADLVVASACESGAGRPTAAGEGPHVLSWAFLAAGARAVVASAWRVHDRSALQLMKRFHLHLAAGAPRVEALVRAQREFLRQDGDPDSRLAEGGHDHMGGGEQDVSHPYFWAGFSLMGDWR